MKTARIIITCIMAATLIGCSSSQPVYKPYPPMPIEPQWQQFTRAPIISVQQDGPHKNFVVSDQFVSKVSQMDDFIKRTKTWKTENAIP